MKEGAPRARRRAARYFAVQAAAGAAWWIAVFVNDDVRRLTLGGWNPVVIAAVDIPLFVIASAITAGTGRALWALLTATWTVAVTVALTGYAVATREAGWGALLMAFAAGGTVLATMVIARGSVPVGWFFLGPFSFRPAPDRGRLSNLLHSLGQLVVFWTAFFAVVPSAISWAERRLRLDAPLLDAPLFMRCGVAVFVLGSAMGLWSCIAMAIHGEGTPLPVATARELVTAGPYRFVRNPMAVAGAAQTVGAGLYLGSWMVVLSALVGAVLWNAFIRPAEEADLRARFGLAYDAYRQRARCWIPTPPPR